MTALAMVHDGGLVGTGVQMVVKSIRGVRLQAVLGTDSTALIAGPQPDVDAYIVLETMQAESTVNALDLLRRGRDPVPCLIIALHRNPPSALAAACAGATGYLLNPTRVEITQAIRAMVAGETFFSPEVVGWFIEEIQNRPLTSVTPQEVV